ncbi:SxtJ family membrane protein [Arcticibacterium luteifluviistationis]|uniref:Uncharacterized protein n=1 Tax=Arcticibacterium luteifluviistationis TaxID=1784714 RepID=A0A2Z4GG16_9BACT|nr:SxtJ family membrane protein [Arcticibacterium luteifluviistationis]AWV99938.1 hypothetical protein DJ013_17880 [Arcticibacterium luteifluviistationis]
MEKQNNAEIILSIVVGFLAFYFIFDIQGLLYAAGIIGLLGLLSSSFASLISKVWLKLAEVLGRINGSILLTIIFFLVLTPMALLMRLFNGGATLNLKKPSKTTFAERNHEYTADDLKNIW